MRLNTIIFTGVFAILTTFMSDEVWSADTFAQPECAKKIAIDESFVELLRNKLGDEDGLTNENIKKHDALLYEKIADLFFNYCEGDYKAWNEVADADYLAFEFTFKSKKYRLKLNTDELFAWKTPTRWAGTENISYIVVLPSQYSDLQIGNKVKYDDIPKYFFDEQCSVHNSKYSTQTAFNRKAKPLITEEMEKKLFENPDKIKSYDPFIDKRGRIYVSYITNDTLSYKGEKEISFKDYRVNRNLMKSLAQELKGSQCSGLLLFLVQLGFIHGYNPGLEDITILSEPIKIE